MNLQKVSVVLLAIIALGLIFVAVDVAQTVLMPLVIALLFSFVLAPVVEKLHKLRVPRGIAIVLVILLILGVFFLIGLFFYTSFQSFVRVFPKYQAKFETTFRGLSIGLTERFGLPTGLLDDMDWSSMIRGYLIELSGTSIDFAKGLFVVTIFLIFLLLERPYLEKKLRAAFAESTSIKIGHILEHINQQIGKYLSVKLFVSSITGVLVWLSLSLIGMDFPIVWGFAGFLMNFVPNIGSMLHFLIVSVLGFIQFYPDSPGKIVAVALSMALIQNVIGNFFDPRLQGHRLDISPFLVLFSLIVWGWLWGPVGMLLATPLTVAVRIVCDNVPALAPVGVLMGKGFGRKKK
ncbi:MAG: AI-2E family transporter [Spirochaetales bacterium]|jgi:AI-2 transport protein TqsA|nr:AI-2E family transporter [Spirochaetales bacterium]